MTINHSKTLIPQDSKWKYINLNPSALTIKGLIKIHKPNQPIRPIVNWRNAPAYKLSKLCTQTINQLTTFNIKNTTQLIQALKETPILPTYKSASLDISNMYSNIPITETGHIINDIMEFNLIDPHINQELLTWYDTVTKKITSSTRTIQLFRMMDQRWGPIFWHPIRDFLTTHRKPTHHTPNTKTQDHQIFPLRL